MKRLFYVLMSLVFFTSAYGAEMYKWVDDKGVVNFTDDYNKIPPAYRDKVKVEGREEPPAAAEPAPSPGTPAPPLRQASPTQSPGAQAPAQSQQEIKRDIYGQGEVYWKDRIRPWRKQLEEAEANLKDINARLQAKMDSLANVFLTPTQSKMLSADMQGLRYEKGQYEAQVNEANQMIEKITREAEEAKADPNWLK